ncbi:unnamed protein product [Clavelina lepadiformis]|uniref:Uncharacterized protein n=1 Tax=Clavelina lepadiformis TaxID=159417 RepID=A0ABP0EYB0_CLALP
MEVKWAETRCCESFPRKPRWKNQIRDGKRFLDCSLRGKIRYLIDILFNSQTIQIVQLSRGGMTELTSTL